MRFTAGPEEDGVRVDAAAARKLGIPRSAARAALEAGTLTVDGKRVRPGYRLRPGEDVSGEAETSVREAPRAEDIDVEVRYSDARVMVVSKPPGLVTHPAGGHPDGTLVNALLGLGVPLSRMGTERPGIVHRLDKDTSGLLLVAKDDEAHEILAAAMKERRIDRTYMALVRGDLNEERGTVEAPIGRHPVARRKMAVLPEGRPAVTHYEVKGRAKGLTLLEVKLETGRTHQIRVHLAHLRHPVLGDPLYGGSNELARSLGLRRPFLHAVSLAFPSPETGRRVAVSEDLPADLRAVLERSGLPVTNG